MGLPFICSWNCSAQRTLYPRVFSLLWSLTVGPVVEDIYAALVLPTGIAQTVDTVSLTSEPSFVWAGASVPTMTPTKPCSDSSHKVLKALQITKLFDRNLDLEIDLSKFYH